MIQTLEATVDEMGNISLLTKVRLKKGRRALVTILDEKSKVSSEMNVERPTNKKVSDQDVLGVWANRKESGVEIARKIRENNRKSK